MVYACERGWISMAGGLADRSARGRRHRRTGSVQSSTAKTRPRPAASGRWRIPSAGGTRYGARRPGYHSTNVIRNWAGRFHKRRRNHKRRAFFAYCVYQG